MIRNGHLHCGQYSISFFEDCIREIAKSENEKMRNTALAIWNTKTDKAKNFKNFLKDLEG